MTAPNTLPDAKLLLQILRYEPATGDLFWLERPSNMFSDNPRGRLSANAATWNTRYAGKPALASMNKGYKHGALFKKTVQAHRVIWKMVHGVDAETVDHIDGNPGNNRIKNLRSVSQSENMRNMRIISTNKSGVTGIYWHSECEKWCAEIWVSKHIHLGLYASFDEALAARKTAEIKYGFHANHGRQT